MSEDIKQPNLLQDAPPPLLDEPHSPLLESNTATDWKTDPVPERYFDQIEHKTRIRIGHSRYDLVGKITALIPGYMYASTHSCVSFDVEIQNNVVLVQ